MREIELAALRRGDVAFHPGPSCGSATVNLAVSTTDVSAKGALRTLACALACACPGALCPVLCARQLLRTPAGQGPEAFVVVNTQGGTSHEN